MEKEYIWKTLIFSIFVISLFIIINFYIYQTAYEDGYKKGSINSYIDQTQSLYDGLKVIKEKIYYNAP